MDRKPVVDSKRPINPIFTKDLIHVIKVAKLINRRRAYWKQHIESWRSSTMTQSAYCRHHELKSHQFVYWKKRFVQTDNGITFVPVKIRRSTSSPSDINLPSLRLIVDGDLKIEVMPDFDPRFLRRLITTLRSLP